MVSALLVRAHQTPIKIEVSPRAGEICKVLNTDAVKSPKALSEHYHAPDVFFITMINPHLGSHEFNRSIRGQDDMVVDFICGAFLIVGKNPATGTVDSLSQERLAQFSSEFWIPETLVRRDGIISVARERGVA